MGRKESAVETCQKQCQKQGPGIPAEAAISYSASSSSFANLVYSITACSYVSQSFSSLAFTTHGLTLCSFFIINFFAISPFCLSVARPLLGRTSFLFDHCQDLCVSNNNFVFIPSIFPMIIPDDQKDLVSIISF